jgi:outer membrane protein assembly factor BamB
MEAAMAVWRRTAQPPLVGGYPISKAVPIQGVGRVPQCFGDDICLITYCDVTKTYAYRRITVKGDVVWQHSVPSGGYASAVHDDEYDLVCGPTLYHGHTLLDWSTGAEVRRLDLQRRVRGTALSLGHGRFLAFAGNRVHTFGVTGPVEVNEFSQHSFFGNPIMHDELVLSMAGHRVGEATTTVITGVDRTTLDVAWESELATDFVPSAEVSGLTAVDGDVVVNLPKGTVARVNGRDGRTKWMATLPVLGRAPVVYRCRPTVGMAPTGERPSVVVTGLRGEVYRLDADTGEIVWAALPDLSAGIWSPALILDDSVVVHSGVFLLGLDCLDGSIKSATPIGFDAYTQPVLIDGKIFICGGDPPHDGYLLAIDPYGQTHGPRATSTYSFGTTRDHLVITVDDPRVTSASVDLSMFGSGAREKLRPDADGLLEWRGDVDSGKRLAESVVFATLGHADGQISVEGVYIDAGVFNMPPTPSALAMDPQHFPEWQPSPTDSGGVVVSAVARRFERPIDATESERVGRWMREQGINSHFLWRGGAERQLIASRLPLPEMRSKPVTAADVEAVISSWEEVQPRSSQDMQE